MEIMVMAGILFLLALWLRLDWLIGLSSINKKCHPSMYPIRHGNIQFYDDGMDWMKVLQEDCEKASSSICILFYIVEPDDVGRKLLELLKHKAKNGVQVRLMMDALGSRKMKKWIKPLQNEGIAIAMSRPLIFRGSFFNLQRRNHRKIAVIDGSIAYIGGFNIGREYVHLHPVLTPWRDYHLRIIGESVQDALKEFEVDWKRDVKNTSPLEAASPSYPVGETRHRIVPSSSVKLEDFMIDLFDKAEHSIFIGSPYFIPTNSLFSCLLRRLEEGISLTLLVPGTPDHPFVKPASYRYLRQLIDHGASVYQLEHGFYHAKAYMIDRRLCDIGTTNFDRRSLLINDEINVLIEDPVIIEQLDKSIQEDLERSILLNREHLRPKSLAEYGKEYLARAFSHLL
ncbi:phospholipase D-like domain-containing protein [Jeotgalibacillus soli]|uniref:PLD phosphodiesterase domain-containing protein n=1 Tax=Jeotgalibacillus soli TaxID=889306 RepID=A0A0C2VLD7_9BACL|nr:phosphatidylserine/phosphatidylglycerophosphate/cardiolipin synthase family protein [Jeotgalibacillus soli]KIL49727.1 hypothetical protein KP78_11950 [Jeotgalibacillus soli]